MDGTMTLIQKVCLICRINKLHLLFLELCMRMIIYHPKKISAKGASQPGSVVEV